MITLSRTPSGELKVTSDAKPRKAPPQSPDSILGRQSIPCSFTDEYKGNEQWFDAVQVASYYLANDDNVDADLFRWCAQIMEHEAKRITVFLNAYKDENKRLKFLLRKQKDEDDEAAKNRPCPFGEDT